MDRKGGKKILTTTLYFLNTVHVVKATSDVFNLPSIKCISKHFLLFSLNHFLELFLLKNGPSREKG